MGILEAARKLGEELIEEESESNDKVNKSEIESK